MSDAPKLKVGNIFREDAVVTTVNGDQAWVARLRFDAVGSSYLDAEDVAAMAVMLAAPHVPGPFERPLPTAAERRAELERQAQKVRDDEARRVEMARAREAELARLRKEYPILAEEIAP